MTLADYKFIYFWEWVHRLLGAADRARLRAAAGVVLGAAARFPRGYKPRLLALLALGGLQGAVGWWMVSLGARRATSRSAISASPRTC